MGARRRKRRRKGEKLLFLSLTHSPFFFLPFLLSLTQTNRSFQPVGINVSPGGVIAQPVSLRFFFFFPGFQIERERKGERRGAMQKKKNGKKNSRAKPKPPQKKTQKQVGMSITPTRVSVGDVGVGYTPHGEDDPSDPTDDDGVPVGGL